MRYGLKVAATGSMLVLFAAANLRCGESLGEPDDSDGGRDEASTRDASDADDADAYVVSDRYESGTRLKASMFVTSEGVRQFRGWYDTMLGAFCDFVRHEDGTLRCVPRGANDTPLYDAAGCDEASRVVFRETCDVVPKFARRQIIVGECEPSYRVYRVGDPVAASSFYSRNVEGDPCPSAATPLDPSAQLLRRAGEVAASELVAGTEVEWTPPAPLAASPVDVVFITGSDGSRGFQRLREKYKGETCELRAPSTIDPTVRCVPTRALLSADFSDPSCTQPAFQSYSAQACARPSFGKLSAASADGACRRNEDFFLVASSPATEAYRKTSTDCSQLPLDAGTYAGATYLAGTPYGLPNFAAATLVPPRVDRRIDRYLYALPDGTKVSRGFADFGRFYDSKRNEDCELRVAADGKIRCIPIAQAVVSVSAKYFTDSACTASVRIATATACEKVVRLAEVASADAFSCGTPHIHVIGAAVTDALYRIPRPGQACALVQPDVNNPRYYVGDEIPPSELAEVVATDPP